MNREFQVTAATSYKWQALQPVNGQACVQGESHVLVMELCSTDLAAALEHAKWRWDRPLITALLQQLLQGIAACHQAGQLLAYAHQSGDLWLPSLCQLALRLLHACPTLLDPSAGHAFYR